MKEIDVNICELCADEIVHARRSRERRKKWIDGMVITLLIILILMASFLITLLLMEEQ